MPLSSQPPVRNDFIDYLKGALIFLVVCGHMIQFPSPAGDTSFYDDPLFKAIYTFHMPLFMAVSGFVSFHAIFSSGLILCVQKRFRQIILPAICWPMLYLVCSLLLRVVWRGSLVDGLHSFEGALASFRPGLWFLWAVFGSMVVVSALKHFKLDRLEFFTAATLVFLFLPDGADIYLFKYTFPFFCLGYALAKGDQIRIPGKIHPFVITWIFVLSVICYLMWKRETYVYVTRMHPSPENLGNIGLRYFAGVVISGAFVLLMCAFYRFAKSSVLANWGRRSLDIYIIHSLIFTGLDTFARPALHVWWFSFLTAPFFAGLLCFVTYEVGQAISHIPVARTLLLGQGRKS